MPSHFYSTQRVHELQEDDLSFNDSQIHDSPMHDDPMLRSGNQWENASNGEDMDIEEYVQHFFSLVQLTITHLLRNNQSPHHFQPGPPGNFFVTILFLSQRPLH